MMYPPKKTQQSPERTKPKDLSNLMNINNKFTGSGGNTSSLAPKRSVTMPKPAVSGIFRAENKLISEPTLFRKYYERGDLPVAVSFVGALRKLQWKMQPQHLDYHLHLPIFFQGLRETEQPYKFLAMQGTEELIEKNPGKLLQVLPQLIIPIKSKAIAQFRGIIYKEPRDYVCDFKENPETGAGRGDDWLGLSAILQADSSCVQHVQKQATQELFHIVNIGDKIDYSQKKNENLSDLIQETLQVLEKHGGEDAYINIKYMIPTYESCMF